MLKNVIVACHNVLVSFSLVGHLVNDVLNLYISVGNASCHIVTMVEENCIGLDKRPLLTFSFVLD